jgi:hypothetical protein
MPKRDLTRPPHPGKMPDQNLMPCKCGAPCSAQVFDSKHVEGTVYMCSKHTQLGGSCKASLASVSAESWNDQQSPKQIGESKPAALLDAIGELALAIRPHYMDADQRKRISAAIETLVDSVLYAAARPVQ